MSIGGTSPEDHTRRILRFILTNELACLYNWKGEDKKALKDTHGIQPIYGCQKRVWSSIEPNSFKRVVEVCEETYEAP
ncbi:hypothetical protein JTB14_010259 [Gonioctena quinquepunctata]|nr:hypothetical protein JTB14_010259 [Gonioctena quinquepunctata]